MSDKEVEATEARLTVGELRAHLRTFDDDCQISITSEEGELFFCRTESRGRDNKDKSILITLELETANHALNR